MYRQSGKRNVRNTEAALDLLHIAIGLIIVVMAVISFTNPDDHLTLFPCIFFLASVLNLVNGYVKISRAGRDNKKKAGGICLILFAVALIALAVISAVSLWR